MLVIVIAPPEPLLNENELQALIPSLGGGDSERVAFLAKVAQADIEPPNKTWGRAFGRQTLELVLDGFGSHRDAIALPYGPLASITSITYVNPDGVSVVLPAEFYVMTATGIRPAVGKCWPTMACVREGLRIRYLTGYEATNPELLPAKNAMRVSVQLLRAIDAREDLFLKRDKADGIGEKEWTVSPAATQMMRDAIHGLLKPYRPAR